MAVVPDVVGAGLAVFDTLIRQPMLVCVLSFGGGARVVGLL